MGVMAAGGYANAAAQVSFCSGTSCTITKLYDQSPEHNDLPISWIQSDVGADAMALPVTVNGNKAYGVKVLDIAAGAVGYRNFNTQGVPTGSQPEGIYEVDVDCVLQQPVLLRLRQRRKRLAGRRRWHHERD